MQALDDTLDCLLEPPPLRPMLARLPRALHLGLLGSDLAPETDVMAVFRKPN
jgi:hypothetical protein